MTTKNALLGAAFILTLILGGAMIVLVVWSRKSEGSALGPQPAVLQPPDAPATIVISCEKGERFGWTTYPILVMECQGESCEMIGRSDLAPEPALFAHCRPDEDFTYDVQSTSAEVLDSVRRPEIAFVLTEAGLVQGALVTRSSGSKSLDLKVLHVVANRHYKATRCGRCQIFVAPPVNLKKYGVAGPS
jgi:hypothetical protein